MKFGFLSERETIHAAFVLRRLQEEHNAKEKNVYIGFMDQEKAIDRVPSKCWNEQ